MALALSQACATPPRESPPVVPPTLQAEADRLADLGYTRWLEAATRVAEIGDRLRVAAAPWCGDDLTPATGIGWTRRTWTQNIYGPAVSRRFADDRVYVVFVAKGMAGERAGFRIGDVLLDAPFYELLFVDDPEAEGPRRVRIERAGEELELEIDAPLGCNWISLLQESELANAYASPNRRGPSFAVVHRPVVREARTEDLALILGHEFGHLLIERGSVDRARRGADREAQADYLGAYLVARAGYALDASSDRLFTSVVGRDDIAALSLTQSSARSHPVTPARTLALRATLDEIERKLREQADLVPDGLRVAAP